MALCPHPCTNDHNHCNLCLALQENISFTARKQSIEQLIGYLSSMKHGASNQADLVTLKATLCHLASPLCRLLRCPLSGEEEISLWSHAVELCLGISARDQQLQYFYADSLIQQLRHSFALEQCQGMLVDNRQYLLSFLISIGESTAFGVAVNDDDGVFADILIAAILKNVDDVALCYTLLELAAVNPVSVNTVRLRIVAVPQVIALGLQMHFEGAVRCLMMALEFMDANDKGGMKIDQFWKEMESKTKTNFGDDLANILNHSQLSSGKVVRTIMEHHPGFSSLFSSSNLLLTLAKEENDSGALNCLLTLCKANPRFGLSQYAKRSLFLGLFTQLAIPVVYEHRQVIYEIIHFILAKGFHQLDHEEFRVFLDVLKPFLCTDNEMIMILPLCCTSSNMLQNEQLCLTLNTTIIERRLNNNLPSSFMEAFFHGLVVTTRACVKSQVCMDLCAGVLMNWVEGDLQDVTVRPSFLREILIILNVVDCATLQRIALELQEREMVAKLLNYATTNEEEEEEEVHASREVIGMIAELLYFPSLTIEQINVTLRSDWTRHLERIGSTTSVGVACLLLLDTPLVPTDLAKLDQYLQRCLQIDEEGLGPDYYAYILLLLSRVPRPSPGLVHALNQQQAFFSDSFLTSVLERTFRTCLVRANEVKARVLHAITHLERAVTFPTLLQASKVWQCSLGGVMQVIMTRRRDWEVWLKDSDTNNNNNKYLDSVMEVVNMESEWEPTQLVAIFNWTLRGLGNHSIAMTTSRAQFLRQVGLVLWEMEKENQAPHERPEYLDIFPHLDYKNDDHLTIQSLLLHLCPSLLSHHQLLCGTILNHVLRDKKVPSMAGAYWVMAFVNRKGSSSRALEDQALTECLDCLARHYSTSSSLISMSLRSDCARSLLALLLSKENECFLIGEKPTKRAEVLATWGRSLAAQHCVVSAFALLLENVEPTNNRTSNEQQQLVALELVECVFRGQMCQGKQNYLYWYVHQVKCLCSSALIKERLQSLLL